MKTRNRGIRREEIVITGIGCVGAGGSSVDELFETFRQEKADRQINCEGKDYESAWAGIMPDVDFKKHIRDGC